MTILITVAILPTVTGKKRHNLSYQDQQNKVQTILLLVIGFM